MDAVKEDIRVVGVREKEEEDIASWKRGIYCGAPKGVAERSLLRAKFHKGLEILI